MSESLAAIGIWCVLAGAWFTLLAAERAEVSSPADLLRRVGGWQIGLWFAVAVPSIVALFVPDHLVAGWRDSAAIADGQWWRLVTSMFLQDGGLAGTVFNLAILAVTLVVVAPVLSGPATAAVFLAGGVAGNLLTMATSGASGAGNSMATIALACFAATLVVVRRRSVGPPVIVMVAAVVLLCVLGDQHGYAALVGVAGGAVVAISQRRKASGGER